MFTHYLDSISKVQNYNCNTTSKLGHSASTMHSNHLMLFSFFILGKLGNHFDNRPKTCCVNEWDCGLPEVELLKQWHGCQDRAMRVGP